MRERRYKIAEKYDNVLAEKFDFGIYVIADMFYCEDKDETYCLILKGFKWLFSQGKEAQTYLWNALYRRINRVDFSKIDRTDFSAEEWQFLESMAQAYQDNEAKHENNLSCNRNINSQIETDRLILTPFNNELNNQYIEFFLQHKDEFERLYDTEYDEEIIKCKCSPITGNLHFAILHKETKEFIGVVELTEESSGVLYNLAYFIMPNYRQSGYAHEAAQRLIVEAFDDGLFILEETIREGVFNKKYPKIECIVARININNTPSIKTIEKLGFQKDGILKYNVRLGDKYLHHYVYTLEKRNANNEEHQ